MSTKKELNSSYYNPANNGKLFPCSAVTVFSASDIPQGFSLEEKFLKLFTTSLVKSRLTSAQKSIYLTMAVMIVAGGGMLVFDNHPSVPGHVTGPAIISNNNFIGSHQAVSGGKIQARPVQELENAQISHIGKTEATAGETNGNIKFRHRSHSGATRGNTIEKPKLQADAVCPIVINEYNKDNINWFEMQIDGNSKYDFGPLADLYIDRLIQQNPSTTYDRARLKINLIGYFRGRQNVDLSNKKSIVKFAEMDGNPVFMTFIFDKTALNGAVGDLNTSCGAPVQNQDNLSDPAPTIASEATSSAPAIAVEKPTNEVVPEVSTPEPEPITPKDVRVPYKWPLSGLETFGVVGGIVVGVFSIRACMRYFDEDDSSDFDISPVRKARTPEEEVDIRNSEKMEREKSNSEFFAFQASKEKEEEKKVAGKFEKNFEAHMNGVKYERKEGEEREKNKKELGKSDQEFIDDFLTNIPVVNLKAIEEEVNRRAQERADSRTRNQFWPGRDKKRN